MNLIDCNNLKVEKYRTYGGLTGSKIGVWYNDNIYMLKTQQSLKSMNFRNVEISYANDPISEYIGSHFFEICGVPVHDTLLGEYGGKLCVLCRDYAYPGKVLEFRELRNSIMDESVKQSATGMSLYLSNIMEVIDKVINENRDSVIQRFWDMFVIDAIIGNTDRNNGNWGFTVDSGELKLYPVYDCGGCLNNKKSDEQFMRISDTEFDTYAYDFTSSYKYDSGKRINPLHYIKDNLDNTAIVNAINKLPVSTSELGYIIDNVKPVISDARADWYRRIIDARINRLRSYVNNPFISASLKM